MRRKEAKKRFDKLLWMKRLHNAHVKSLNAKSVISEWGIRRSTLYL